MVFSAACRGGLVISFLVHVCEGFRVSTHRHVFSSKQPTCQYACGAETVTVDDTEFQIGQHVDYERTDAECLTQCHLGTSGIRCGIGYEKRSKAGIARDQKLCCKSQKCTWRPSIEDGIDNGRWEEKADSEDQLWPLQDYPDGRVNGNTCFCCSEAGIPWDGNVNLKCKFAYGATTDDVWKYALGAVFSIGISDLVWKNNCARYCINFPGYTIAKKALAAHTWAPAEIPERQDPQAVALELEEQLIIHIAAAERGMEVEYKENRDVKQLVYTGDQIRLVLEQAEAPAIAAVMSQETLEHAVATLTALDKITMPRQLENAMAKFGDALKFSTTGDKAAVKAIAEQLDNAIFRAENSDVEVAQLDAAKALQDALVSILKDMAD